MEITPDWLRRCREVEQLERQFGVAIAFGAFFHPGVHPTFVGCTPTFASLMGRTSRASVVGLTPLTFSPRGPVLSAHYAKTAAAVHEVVRETDAAGAMVLQVPPPHQPLSTATPEPLNATIAQRRNPISPSTSPYLTVASPRPLKFATPRPLNVATPQSLNP